MERTLDTMARELQRNFVSLNRGGCGVVAYYTAVFFNVPTVIYLNRDPYRNLFIMDGIGNGDRVSPAHAVVRISDDKCFDADGVHDLQEIKSYYGGGSWPIFNDRELTINKLHQLIYEEERRFYLESNDMSYLKHIISDKFIWNQSFMWDQVPDIKNLILDFAWNFFKKKREPEIIYKWEKFSRWKQLTPSEFG